MINENALQKIQELAAYRENYIRECRRPPLFQLAIQYIGISSKTVHDDAIDLYIRWYDEKFHFGELSGMRYDETSLAVLEDAPSL